MNDKNAFDRQLSREIDHLAGPEPRFDASEVVGKATQTAPRWRVPSPFGMVRLAAAAAVVALFGAILLFGGILDSTQDAEQVPVVGASPSASAEPTPTDAPDELPPEEVTYATGTFEEKFASFLSQDVEGFAATLAGPRWFDVQSSDPRLRGEATLLAIAGDWEAADEDVEGPVGPEPAARVQEVSVYHGRMEIKNEGGAWAGTVGPHIWIDADGAEGGSARFGPTVLNGSGAYESSTAYIRFPYGGPGPGDPPYSIWFSEGGTIDGPFEAVVVNRAIPGFPSDDQWLRELRRTGQTE